jgi:hypothetical protein
MLALARVVGVPVGTSFVVGMMTGCMSMIVVMAGGFDRPGRGRGIQLSRREGRERSR